MSRRQRPTALPLGEWPLYSPLQPNPTTGPGRLLSPNSTGPLTAALVAESVERQRLADHCALSTSLHSHSARRRRGQARCVVQMPPPEVKVRKVGVVPLPELDEDDMELDEDGWEDDDGEVGEIEEQHSASANPEPYHLSTTTTTTSTPARNHPGVSITQRPHPTHLRIPRIHSPRWTPRGFGQLQLLSPRSRTLLSPSSLVMPTTGTTNSSPGGSPREPSPLSPKRWESSGTLVGPEGAARL